MSYRDDDAARTERATQLIDDIAQLERQKLAAAKVEAQLDAAKAELASMQATSTVALPASEDKTPPIVTHVLVFAGTAAVTFFGYTLLV
jgi:hypothetical protein